MTSLMTTPCRRALSLFLVCLPLLWGTFVPQAIAGSSPLVGGKAMVASAHPLASRVGRDVMLDGGNAVDAAVAVAFALAVVEPYSSGIGGGGFAVTFMADSSAVSALDFRETAPAAASRDMYVVDGQADVDLSQNGPLAVATPGLVAGLWQLHQRYGQLPWAKVVLPAAGLAGEGFPVYPGLRRRIEYHAGRFNAAAREVFLPAGTIPELDALLVQEDLSAVLQGIATFGPDAFYGGSVAGAIASCVQESGGLLTVDDLAAYRPHWRQPVHGRYRGLEVYSMPPPSSGGVHLVQMLNILERYDLAATGHLSAASCHLLTESMKFAFADRSRWLGDPDFVKVPVAMLTSRAHADSQAACILVDETLPWRQIEGVEILPQESNETTHLSVVDEDGNAVAATLTINLSFGAGLVAAGTGIVLNDEMDDFVAAPGTPNAFGLIGGEANSIAPLKRPLSSMTPTIILDEGRVFMVTGSPGGSRIITTTLQTILNVVDHQMNVAQAVAVPRIHSQWYPPLLYVEAFGLSPDTTALLGALGHVLQVRTPMGNAQAIVIDRETGQRLGASDPRGCGAPSGY